MTDTPRYFVASETRGFILATDSYDDAKQAALVASVNTGHTVHLHDRATEPGGHNGLRVCGCGAWDFSGCFCDLTPKEFLASGGKRGL